MKNIFLLVIGLLVSISCTSQKEEVVYLFFDSNSSETFTVKKEGIVSNKKKFRKRNIDRTKIDFYIFEEYFKYHSNENETMTLNQKEFEALTINNIQDLKKKWKKSNLFSKQKVYDNIYIVVLVDKEVYQLYEVTWINSIN